MSLKPSRIHHIRKRGGRQSISELDDEVFSDDMPQLPECLGDIELEDDEAVRRVPPMVSAGAALGAVGSAKAGGAVQQTTGKLRHLKVAAQRGHLEAMYLLAQECDDRVARIQWLTMAAERGHVRAMHDLGLASIALHERRRWLLRAAQHGWAEAMAELGDVECS